MTDDSVGWDYKHDGQTKTEPPHLEGRGSRPAAKKAEVPESVEWQASEYIEHHRGAGWYLALIIVAAILTGTIYLLTKDYFAAAIVVATAIVVLIFSMQKPREVTYGLNSDGLRINDKLYPYGHFKSFAVVREGAMSSINLIAIKRFLPVISLYFDPGQEAQIVQVLGNYLPYEDRNLDGVERLTRRLRF